MPEFCANLTTMFNETDFLERFERANKAGFKYVEFMFPYDWEKELVVEKLDRYGLKVALHNFPAGDWAKGERGITCLPDRVGEFQSNVGKAIEYAEALRCPRLNCMIGLTPKGSATEKIMQTCVTNLQFAAVALEKKNIRLMIEPINNIDMPGNYLIYTQQALDIIKEVSHPNIWLQYDIYHAQIMEGNLTRTIQDNIQKIGHMQLADVPGRHEPGTGEINFDNLFRFIDESGYRGIIGCEYRPLGNTEDGLGWVKPYLKKGEN
jgi:hydroxypyruvate isomerase